MNAVEIEEAVSKLADAPFDVEAFPYAFLEAFGNKETTLRRLRSGNTNQSDLPGGVLQRNNIHIKVCPEGEVPATLAALRESPATARHKAKFILATDGKELHSENLTDDVPPLACEYRDLPDHFGFFLPLAGITTVRQISENAFDIRATGRLNRLYVELSKHNPDWDTRREDLNHFFARLIFCFFAEDTGIFPDQRLFTRTVEMMTERDGSNTHEVLAELFRAMNTRREDRAAADIRPYALKFPYVNGGLFSGSMETPRFSKIARSYLLFVGGLDWKLINPDIFGSMIQAVAEDEERGALGMHYTSVPNILKVLNPLFLDDLRQKLEEAGDGKTPGSARKLLNLRNRLARIRVFDPACGSGNFLVIAYKEMRKIEAIINERRDEMGNPSVIPISNFRGIEIRTFAAEIARLALIIAEFQCDVIYGGEMFARGRVLPLDQDNWITCGNALRLNWLEFMDARGTGVKVTADDLYSTPLDQAEIDFENEGGETYICGNPPYKGSQDQTPEQKDDLEVAFGGRLKSTKSADYVAGWFIRGRDFILKVPAKFAFVATNSINQGRQVALYWPTILGDELEINFAVPSFQWRNLAANAAVVTVSIVGVSRRSSQPKQIYAGDSVKTVGFIGPYLVPDHNVIVEPRKTVLSGLGGMDFGSMPNDGGGLLLTPSERDALIKSEPGAQQFLRKFIGSDDAVYGKFRYCLWISAPEADEAKRFDGIRQRIALVEAHRLKSEREATVRLANVPYSFGEVRHKQSVSLLIPRHSSEERQYLPFDFVGPEVVVADSAIALPSAKLFEAAIFASRMHLVWISTVCGKLETRYRYSNTLGWNTFPVPALTDQNKVDLTRCAEEILLAREAHFPATIADLYDPEQMPADLRAAHERNDETLERIYIGRRFKNDTERLEKLFELYTQMTAKQTKCTPQKGPKKPRGSKLDEANA
jgi:hypothetical protein